MRLPYIRVKQKGEVFFLTKIKTVELKKHVNFHFREPYSSMASLSERIDATNYIEKIQRKGLEIKPSDEGIQRRLQIERINSIKKFIENDEANFFPNSIIISIDMTNSEEFEEQYLNYENEEIGYFFLPDDTSMTIIDGQHRLAGLFSCAEEIVDEMEIAAVLLFNISISTAAKLFSDINGTQKPINRSLIYDLLGEINVADPEFDQKKRVHKLCQKFYSDSKSPLYRQIKMLGIGNGAISQAFFVDYVYQAIKEAGLENKSLQEIYNQWFFYFSAFQSVFPDDWPVPRDIMSLIELDRYASKVLVERKSQLTKTNGFGAISRVFPLVYKLTDGTYDSYVSIVKTFKGIRWEGQASGTGRALQNQLAEKMIQCLKNSFENIGCE